MIKVLHVIYSLGLGGAEYDLVNKAKILKTNYDYKIDVCCLVEEGELASLARQSKIGVFCLGMHHKIDIIALFKFLGLVKRIKPDILHLHLFESWLFGVIANLLFFLRLPIIVTIQSTKDRMKPYEIFLNKYLSRFTKKIIASSTAVKQGLVSLNIPEDKIEVIYNCVDFERFKKYQKQLSSVPTKNKIKILTIARLIKEKGIDYLLKSARLLKEKYKLNFLLNIIGYGPLYKQLLELRNSLGLYNEVKFLGKVVNIEEELAKADLFVLPSLSEALGLVLVEAAACKIPIIGTNVGGIKEIIKDNQTGLLAEPANEEDLAEKIHNLLMDKQKQDKLVENCYQFVKEKFSVRKLALKLHKLYSSL
jgi:glycosyltransferase involved in cell wall biosynthesis